MAGRVLLYGGTGGIGAGIIVNNGTLDFAGSIAGNVQNNGTLYVGNSNSVGTLTINGNFVQTSTGTLVFDLGGTAQGQSDQLSVTGTAALAGALSVNLVGGYVPITGDSIVVMTFASSSGTFGPVSGFTTNYDPTDVTLVSL